MRSARDGWERTCRRAGGRYFLLQGTLGAAWWLGLAAVPAARPWFGGESLLKQIFLADAVVFVVGSWVAGGLALRARAGAIIAGAMVTGGAMYAALFILASCTPWRSGLLGAAVMGAATGASLIATLLVGGLLDRETCFRSAPKASWASTRVRTAAQSSVFWGVLLVAVPAALHLLETWAGVPGFGARPTQLAGLGLFLIASALNAWSGLVFAKQGDGTPLPLDTATRLVVAGPYRWLRNPMAVSGLTQGLAVGIALGSVPTLAYVVLGGLVWNTLVRPLEEYDLQKRFGDAYESYRGEVRCWWPRLRPIPRRAP